MGHKLLKKSLDHDLFRTRPDRDTILQCRLGERKQLTMAHFNAAEQCLRLVVDLKHASLGKGSGSCFVIESWGGAWLNTDVKPPCHLHCNNRLFPRDDHPSSGMDWINRRWSHEPHPITRLNFVELFLS